MSAKKKGYKGMPRRPRSPEGPHPLDLTSALDQAPAIKFGRSADYKHRIVAFRCKDLGALHTLLQQSLHNVFDYAGVEVKTKSVNLAYQLLPGTEEREAILLFYPDVAHDVNETDNMNKISIFALIDPQHDRPCFFWTSALPAELISTLDFGDLTTPLASWGPLPAPYGLPTDRELQSFSRVIVEAAHEAKTHARLLIFLRETFLLAIRLPESPDWTFASSICNYSPSTYPANWETLLASYRHAYARDDSDDRYREELAPPDRFLASQWRFPCARYMKFKRIFFEAFYADNMGKEKITKRGIRGWMNWAQSGFGVHLRKQKADEIVGAWNKLGWVDECEVCGWEKKGNDEAKDKSKDKGDGERDKEAAGSDRRLGVGDDDDEYKDEEEDGNEESDEGIDQEDQMDTS